MNDDIKENTEQNVKIWLTSLQQMGYATKTVFAYMSSIAYISHFQFTG